MEGSASYFSAITIARHMMDIAHGLQFLHSHNLIHRFDSLQFTKLLMHFFLEE